MFRHVHNPERFLIVAFLFVIVGSFIYLNSFNVGFQLDDLSVIVRNLHIRHPEKVIELFRYDPTRFLSHWTFALNFFFGGLRTPYYHLVSVILHVTCALLVYFLIARTLVLAKIKGIQSEESICLVSFFCALVFLAHPVQTESVTYIVQRSTLLAALFYFASLILYLKLKENFRWPLYAASLAVVFLGTVTKPIFITLPLAILLYEVCFFDFLGRLRKKEIRLKTFFLFLPYLSVVLVIPFFLMLFSLNYMSEPFDAAKLTYATRVTSEISRWDYLLTQSRVLLTYLRLLVFPINQNLDYDFPLSRSFFEPQTFFSCLAVFSILWIALRRFHKQKIVAFGIFWFFIVLIPESSIFPIPDVIFEHRLYMAVVGLSVITGVGLFTLLQSVRRYSVYGLLIIFSLSLVAYTRNEIWRHPLILWKDVVSKSPLKPRPHHILADVYFEMGFLDSAEAEYQKTIALNKGYLQAYNNLGRLYSKQGRGDEAQALFKTVLERMPEHYEANINLGNVYYRRAQWYLS